MMKKTFLTGLVSLLPLAVTIWVVAFVVGFLTRPFMGVVTDLLSRLPMHFFASQAIIRTISQILILIAIFLFVIFIGMVARWFFFNTVLKIGDRILHRIPFINKVYKTTKEITNILFVSNKNSFKQVVLVPFPYKECYCLGLITREAPHTCTQEAKREMVSVFIPTTPNPTTGFLILSPAADLIYMEMKSEEAIKYIVSCGVIQPAKAENP